MANDAEATGEELQWSEPEEGAVLGEEMEQLLTRALDLVISAGLARAGIRGCAWC